METLTAPQPHMPTQPGLRAHSYSDADTLMHRFRVDVPLPGGGWMGVASAPAIPEAEAKLDRRIGGRIVDQHNYNPVTGQESVYATW